jgi:hypothetical protein
MGDKEAFRTMFIVRAIAFAAVAFRSELISSWIIFALTLACHGGGFGLIPKIVGGTALRHDSASVGYVLSAWGVGGIVGIAIFDRAVMSGETWLGFGGLAALMMTGAVMSSRYWVAREAA